MGAAFSKSLLHALSCGDSIRAYPSKTCLRFVLAMYNPASYKEKACGEPPGVL